MRRQRFVLARNAVQRVLTIIIEGYMYTENCNKKHAKPRLLSHKDMRDSRSRNVYINIHKDSTMLVLEYWAPRTR